MMGCDEVVEWLTDGARPALDTREVAAELCDRLLGCGIPVWRFGLFVLTLHPQIMGQAFLWKPGVGVEVISASFETFETEAFRQSPVRRVIDTRASLRRKLGGENCPSDFDVTRELKAQGATDYLAVPLFFASGGVHGSLANPHPSPEQLLPNEYVERSRRMHGNDVENIPLFLVTGLLYVCTAPSNVTALSVFAIYVLSRFAHFYVVLTARPHEVRALFWTVGSVAIYLMAGAVLWTALRP